ncbi:kinase-like protein [Lentithecium fluviatile CBS 122367]|uniref:Kinase-like protein n=1 Tax=Lentithecium fluviatile CBS 122367 TaxID=1168545 RepID=A0A6G1IL85_9PLEO|nr:kinase-like protein [Lentithecium fluviatile CBS 122367]
MSLVPAVAMGGKKGASNHAALLLSVFCSLAVRHEGREAYGSRLSFSLFSPDGPQERVRVVAGFDNLVAERRPPPLADHVAPFASHCLDFFFEGGVWMWMDSSLELSKVSSVAGHSCGLARFASARLDPIARHRIGDCPLGGIEYLVGLFLVGLCKQIWVEKQKEEPFLDSMEGRIISSEELLRAERFADFTPVFKVDAHTVVKTGDSVRLAEAAAMRLVRDLTTIPVPQVFNAYKDDDSGHIRIVMEFIEGDVLNDVWDEFSLDQKMDIIQQLRRFFSQLRHIKGAFIGAYGPYEDEHAFNQGIATALQRSQHGAWVNMVSDMVLKSLHGHEVVMTHGGFCPRNIIVQGTKVVAVLDWGLSGYYPEYWEYVKALYRPAWESGWIKDGEVDKILQPYFSELAVMLHTREII